MSGTKFEVDMDAFDKLTLQLGKARAVINAVIVTEENLSVGDMYTLCSVVRDLLDDAAEASDAATKTQRGSS